MPGDDHPVYFTRSAPFNVESGHLVFYDVVKPSVLSRSSVLSCIAEADGGAQLPDSVTVSDFRKWLDAATDTQEEFEGRLFTFMCAAIKVADAVDDKHIDDWITVAAAKLAQASLSSTPTEIKNKISDGVVLLTDDLRHRVVAAAAINPDDKDRLLSLCPTGMHASVLAATISPDKELHMALGDASLPAVKALASIPASPPSVLSVAVDRGHESFKSWKTKSEVISHLASALQHHASLTSFQLSSAFCFPPLLELLFPAVASLTGLQSLRFGGRFDLSAEVAALLKQTLHALSHLRDLELEVDEVSLVMRKRHRDEDAPAPPQLCLASLLSPATALTSLSLRTSRHASAHDPAILIAAEPLALPHLVQLTAFFNDDVRLAASFFTQLSAPLTSLQLCKRLQLLDLMPSAAAPHAGQLLHSLAAFTQLRCFTAMLPTDYVNSQWYPQRCSIFDALTSALPAPFTALRHLQSFTFAAEPPLARRSVTLLAQATSSLTHIRLGFYSPDRFENQSPAEAWTEFFHALCLWTLQHLDLDWAAHCPPGHGISAAALAPLTQLTVLRVRGWACLHSAADGEALAGMIRLQQLCVEHTADEFKLPQSCVPSLRALTALTSLTLKTSGADNELAPGLVAQLPPRSLPVLQELRVSMCDGDPAEALAGYAAALPALRQLTVLFLAAPFLHDLDEDDSDSDDNGMRTAFLEGLYAAKAHLAKVADESNFTLSFECDDYELYAVLFS